MRQNEYLKLQTTNSYAIGGTRLLDMLPSELFAKDLLTQTHSTRLIFCLRREQETQKQPEKNIPVLI
uniref:hypothetical protein n=1 Tax=Candidatus Electrothrix sp. TaxID=2170559 RepID=UPI004056E571